MKSTSFAACPLLIVGPSRSGSTLLARMLDAHPALAIMPETGLFATLYELGVGEHFRFGWQRALFLNDLWDALRQFDPVAARAVAAAACASPFSTGETRALVEELGERYLCERGACWWGEQNPTHSLRLPTIVRLFPEARYIRIVRDPRDILVSHLDAWYASRYETRLFVQPLAQIKYYYSRLLDGSFWRSRPNRMVRYEELVENPREELARLCRWLGLPMSEKMIEPNTGEPTLQLARLAHHRNLLNPANCLSVGRFASALSSKQTALVEHFLAPELQQLGYARVSGGEVTGPEREVLRRAQAAYAARDVGYYRGRVRLHGALKLCGYGLFGPRLARWRGRKLAVTAEQWRVRLNMAGAH